MAIVIAAAAAVLLALGLAAVALRFRRRARAAEAQLARHRLALELLPGTGLVLLDRSLRAQLAAGPGLAAFGLEPAQLAGRRLSDALSPEAGAILDPALRAALEGSTHRLQLSSERLDHFVQVAPIPGPEDRPGGVLIALHDVTERRSRERGLSELASRDGLTGLWNRRRLEHELERLLGGPDPATGVVLLVDLDDFKRVNDTLGHEAGDALLARVARALESAVRRTDLVARLGGDEFALLLPGMAEAEAGAVAEKVAAAVRSVWPPGLPGGASVGVASVGGRHLSPGAVLAAADRGMYGLKRSRKLRRAS